MGKRETVLETINAGGATKETLMAAIAPTDAKGLASIFTTLRLMGSCPVAQEDGTFKVVSAEEWAEIKASRSAGAKPAGPAKTPAERLEAAKKRVERCGKQNEAAQARFDEKPGSEELDLRSQLAAVQLRLAEIEIEKAETAVEEAPPADDAEVPDALPEEEEGMLE